MGGKDFCCSVSGTPHIWGEEELVSQIFQHVPNDSRRNRVTSFTYKGKKFTNGGHAVSPKVLQGLRFSIEDKEASNDCVLIAGYQPLEDGSSYSKAVGPLFSQMDGEPDIANPTHAVAIFNVIPDDEGFYALRSDPDTWYNLWWEDSGYYMTFTSYCILKTVAPELDASTIYRTFTHRRDGVVDSQHDFLGTPKAINYGIVEKLFDQYIDVPEICEDSDTDGFWTYLLCYSSRSDEEILDEVWNGEGNLWVFVRPDRFPIGDATALPPLSHFPERNGNCIPEDGSPTPRFDLIPPDILFLICEQLPLRSFLHVLSLNYRIRSIILPHSNELAYKAMKNCESCYFPSQPIKTPDGTREREEHDWWEREWLKVGGIALSDVRQKAPWLSYWIQCSRSASMRNRKRIWRAAESIRSLALEYGFVR